MHGFDLLNNIVLKQIQINLVITLIYIKTRSLILYNDLKQADDIQKRIEFLKYARNNFYAIVIEFSFKMEMNVGYECCFQKILVYVQNQTIRINIVYDTENSTAMRNPNICQTRIAFHFKITKALLLMRSF